MKRALSLLLALLLLSGCAAPSPEEQTDLTPAQVLALMLDAVPEGTEDLTPLPQDDIEYILASQYGLSPAGAAMVRHTGAQAFELAVLRYDEPVAGDLLETVTQKLRDYLLRRQGDFTGYAPDQAELVENACILTKGNWAALIISEDTAAASSAFEVCFGKAAAASAPATPAPWDGRLPYVDPNIDDMTLYDTSAILSAWEGGDRAALSAKDLATLEAAEAILAQKLSADMSDYDKERALYGWLVSNVDYDWDHQDPTATMDPDSAAPYGGLVNRRAICLGFATAFQLLMDMAGVECITVVGAAFQSREDHAWNMVRLNGQWYCVDATWDMGLPNPDWWSYFNVTSQHMADTDHQWDYESVPEAAADDGGAP